MATFNKFNAFVEAVAEKKHDLGSDQLVVALTNSAPVAATNAILADITEISYANCSSRNITTTSSSQTGGTYSLVLEDLTLTASGGDVGPFRYAVTYNDDATNDDLICWHDYGESITVHDGETFKVDFGDNILTLQ